jgi:hypothetical protein
MTSRAEKLRRRQHRKHKKHRRAYSLGSEIAPFKDILVVDPPGAAKMSEALSALVEPEWHQCPDEEAMRKLLTLGVAAWNAALMKGTERSAFLESLAQSFPTQARQEFLQVVEPFIHRKEKLFPHNKRPILGFELTSASGKPYLSVLSGLA